MGLTTLQGSHELLDALSTDDVVGGVSLRVHVDKRQTGGILVDDTAYSTVAAATDPPDTLIAPAVPHGDEQIEDDLFEEGRVDAAKSLQRSVATLLDR